jgi:hypothetical protein
MVVAAVANVGIAAEAEVLAGTATAEVTVVTVAILITLQWSSQRSFFRSSKAYERASSALSKASSTGPAMQAASFISSATFLAMN